MASKKSRKHKSSWPEEQQDVVEPVWEEQINDTYNGQVQYPNDQGYPGVNDGSIPREPPFDDVSGITTRFEELSVDSESSQLYSHAESHYGTDPTDASHYPQEYEEELFGEGSYQTPSQYADISLRSSKGKGKANATQFTTSDGDDEPYIPPPSEHNAYNDPYIDDQPYDPHNNPVYPNEDYENDLAMETTLEASRRDIYSHGGLDGGPSMATMPTVYEDAYGRVDDDYEEAEGAQELTASAMDTANIVDSILPGFRIYHSSSFQYGAVFKLFWSEPLGNNKQPPKGPRHWKPSTVGSGKLGDDIFYWGVRRFIVVGTEGGNSICVPILTYGHQGCKKGAKPENHGIIYRPPSRPHLTNAEKKLEKEGSGLGMDPVRMHITQEGEKLDVASRVNYSKHVTVEHNWKVLFIGQVYDEDIDIVERSVAQCWENRLRSSHKHKHESSSSRKHHKRK